jgi:hypothetical protein
VYAAKIENDAVVATYQSESELRLAHQRTAFPLVIAADDVAPLNVVLLEPAPVPTHDRITQRVIESIPIQIGDRWWQDWKIVDLSAEEAAASLAAEKVRLREAINAERDRLEAAGFSYVGKRLDSTERSVLRFNVAVQAAQAAIAAGQTFQLDWTCADNSELPLDAAGVIGIPVAFALYGNALHQHARALKAAVESATTAAELAAVEIYGGWPSGE